MFRLHVCVWAVCIAGDRGSQRTGSPETGPTLWAATSLFLYSSYTVPSCSFGSRSGFLDLFLFAPTVDLFGSPGFFLVPFPELLFHLQAFTGFLLQDLHTSSKWGVSGITGVNLQMLMASRQAQCELLEPARLNLLTNAACQLSRVTALVNSGAGILTS